jgi:hypothetical protein
MLRFYHDLNQKSAGSLARRARDPVRGAAFRSRLRGSCRPRQPRHRPRRVEEHHSSAIPSLSGHTELRGRRDHRRRQDIRAHQTARRGNEVTNHMALHRVEGGQIVERGRRWTTETSRGGRWATERSADPATASHTGVHVTIARIHRLPSGANASPHELARPSVQPRPGSYEAIRRWT